MCCCAVLCCVARVFLMDSAAERDFSQNETYLMQCEDKYFLKSLLQNPKESDYRFSLGLHTHKEKCRTD